MIGPLKIILSGNLIKYKAASGQIIEHMVDPIIRKNMKHRKTLVAKEGWIKLDDWFLGMPPKKDGRNQWHSLGRIWGTCIAHQCPDGSIRAPTSLQIYHRKRKAGGLGIYGRCSACKA